MPGDAAADAADTVGDAVHRHGEALAAVDAHLNDALREAGGDELEAYDRLLREDARRRGGPAPADPAA